MTKLIIVGLFLLALVFFQMTIHEQGKQIAQLQKVLAGCVSK